MVRVEDTKAKLPAWMPNVKGTQRPQFVLRCDPLALDDAFVFEVRGNEFTTGSKATGSQFSIRFPRVLRDRTGDKGAEDCTTSEQISKLVAANDDGVKPNAVVTLPLLQLQGTSAPDEGSSSNGVDRADGAVASIVKQDARPMILPAGPSGPPPADTARMTTSAVAGAPDGAGKGKAKAVVDMRPLCKYGANCYRKNPEHRKEFRHDDGSGSGDACSGGADDGSIDDPPKRKAGGKAKAAESKKAKRRGPQHSDDEADSSDEAFVAPDGDDGWEDAETDDDAIDETAVLPRGAKRQRTAPASYAQNCSESDADTAEDEDVGGSGEDGDDDKDNAGATTDDEDEAEGDDPMHVSAPVPTTAPEALEADTDEDKEDQPAVLPIPAVRSPVRGPTPTALAGPTTDKSPSSVPGVASSSTAAASPNSRWEVTLGNQWKAYDSVVQRQLEAAHVAREAQVEVTLRGEAYVVKLKGDMVQEKKDDPTRWRAVRRVDV